MEHADETAPGLYSISPAAARAAAVRAARVAEPPPTYRSPRRRARATLALLGITIGLLIGSLLAEAAQRVLLNRGVGQISLSEWQTSSSLIVDLSYLEIGLYLITAVAFLMWLHRCYRSLVELGVQGMRFTPGWAVGYWFIPVLSLFRPKQIMDDLWRATAPQDAGTEPAKRSLTAFWWGTLIASAVVSRVAPGAHAETIGDLKHYNTWLIVSDLLELTAAVLAYRLVSSLTDRQELRVPAATP
jgi:uncharacterized protein DUF4328